jgi:hypothetical protein
MPQHSHDVEYRDIQSSVAEALTETLRGQAEEMRAAFAKALGNQ